MFLITISCIALCIFLFSMDMSWDNMISGCRNELVFEGRNKSYGAYALRREHHMNVFYALLLSVGLIGGGMLAVRFLGGDFQSKISPASSPVILDVMIDIPPAEKKPERKEKTEAGIQRSASAASSGSVSAETEIVEHGDEQQPSSESSGADGDAPSDLIQPYDPGSDGGGNSSLREVGGEATAKKRHTFVKNMPEFPGGMEELIRYVQSHVKYTDYELMHNVGGTMYVSFTVFQDGHVGEIIVERGIPYGDRLEKRVIRVLAGMPVWKPGDNGDEPLPVIMKMPVKFELRQ